MCPGNGLGAKGCLGSFGHHFPESLCRKLIFSSYRQLSPSEVISAESPTRPAKLREQDWRLVLVAEGLRGW